MFYKSIFLLFVVTFSIKVLGSSSKALNNSSEVLETVTSAVKSSEALSTAEFEAKYRLAERLSLNFFSIEREKSYNLLTKIMNTEHESNKYRHKAASLLAWMYLEGKISQEYEDFTSVFKNALNLLKEISRNEQTSNKYRIHTMILLARAYLEGKGFEKDQDAARLLLEQAGNNPIALYYLGNLMRQKKLDSKAQAYFESALREGYKNPKFKNSLHYFRIKYALASILLKSDNYGDLRRSHQLFVDIISVEHINNEYKHEATVLLGWMYLEGKGVQRDYNKAHEYFKKERQWDYLANYYLGRMYYYGLGVPRNHFLAEHYFSFSLRNIEFNAFDQTKYPPYYKITYYYRALYFLGRLLIEKPETIKRGIKNLEQVAQNNEYIGDSKFQAANILGLLYRERFKDYEQATYWFQEASKAKGADRFYPHFNLAVMHGEGEAGVLPNGRWNFPKAYHLMNLALHSGGGDKKARRTARRMLKKFKEFTNSDQVEKSNTECLSVFGAFSKR